METNIYIVESSYGSWEDSYEIINGVFTNIDDARNLKNEIIRKIDHISDTFQKFVYKYESENNEDKYEYYVDALDQANEFNGVSIRPYILEKIEPSWLDHIFNRKDKLKRLINDISK